MLEQIIDVVRRAGEMVLSAHDIAAGTHEKTSAADLVTEYDLAVEAFLKEQLPPLCPGSIFYGEEEAENADPSRGWAFIVDPIDGTTNFIRRYRPSAISAGLVKDGEGMLGLVYDPWADELFSAVRGQGAFCNGNPIHAAEIPLENALFVFGTAPYHRELAEASFAVAKEVFLHCGDLRRCGSAALDLCYIAAGRCDGFFEAVLSPWDYAGASVILQEAGAHIGTVPGRAFTYQEPQPILAGTDALFRLLQEAAGKHLA